MQRTVQAVVALRFDVWHRTTMSMLRQLYEETGARSALALQCNWHFTTEGAENPTATELREAIDSGIFEIGVHGRTHKYPFVDGSLPANWDTDDDAGVKTFGYPMDETRAFNSYEYLRKEAVDARQDMITFLNTGGTRDYSGDIRGYLSPFNTGSGELVNAVQEAGFSYLNGLLADGATLTVADCGGEGAKTFRSGFSCFGYAVPEYGTRHPNGGQANPWRIPVIDGLEETENTWDSVLNTLRTIRRERRVGVICMHGVFPDGTTLGASGTYQSTYSWLKNIVLWLQANDVRIVLPHELIDYYSQPFYHTGSIPATNILHNGHLRHLLVETGAPAANQIEQWYFDKLFGYTRPENSGVVSVLDSKPCGTLEIGNDGTGSGAQHMGPVNVRAGGPLHLHLKIRSKPGTVPTKNLKILVIAAPLSNLPGGQYENALAGGWATQKLWKQIDVTPAMVTDAWQDFPRAADADTTQPEEHQFDAWCFDMPRSINGVRLYLNVDANDGANRYEISDITLTRERLQEV